MKVFFSQKNNKICCTIIWRFRVSQQKSGLVLENKVFSKVDIGHRSTFICAQKVWSCHRIEYSNRISIRSCSLVGIGTIPVLDKVNSMLIQFHAASQLWSYWSRGKSIEDYSYRNSKIRYHFLSYMHKSLKVKKNMLL